MPHRPSPARRQLLGAAAGLAVSWQAPLLAAEAAPVIGVRLLDGREFSLDAMKGKLVFVNFWATWCGPCRVEMPEIDAYYRLHREQGFEVLALSTDELADEAKVLEAARPYSFPVAMMKRATLAGFGRIWRMPVSALVGRDGHFVRKDWFIEPKLDAAALDAVIKPLL